MLQITHLLLFAFCLLMFAFLIQMLVSNRFRSSYSQKKPKGHCPLCGHPLYTGEKVRSNQVEIGNVEVQTRIKGCIYCVSLGNKRRRSCPICKRDVPQGEFILASSDPRVDRLKLAIKGCRHCFPQGF